MYLASWKEAHPAGEVHASTVGRKPFQPARICLAGQLNVGYQRLPACGCGCGFPLKKQPDIRM
jgi:hypothetical protein